MFRLKLEYYRTAGGSVHVYTDWTPEHRNTLEEVVTRMLSFSDGITQRVDGGRVIEVYWTVENV